MSDLFQALSAPFPPDRVSWRVGSTNSDKTRGMALAYIDARDVMDRLDAVCGPAGWQCDYPHANGKTVCRVGVKVDGEWIWKADGAGDTDVEAEKGALSDAFKRAAVRWGIGRYLYDLPAPWVELETRGRTSIIKESEHDKLRRLLSQYGETPKTPPPVAPQRARKSSAQAKKDGDHEKVKTDIAGLDLDGVRDWRENFDRYTQDLPISWLDSIHNMLDVHEAELKGAANVADAEAELDAGFRGAVSAERADRMAGGADHRQGAPA